MMTACAALLLSGCEKPIVTTDPINCQTYNLVEFGNDDVLGYLVANDKQMVRDIASNNELYSEC